MPQAQESVSLYLDEISWMDIHQKRLGLNEKGTVFYAKHFRGVNLEDLKNLSIVRR